MRKNKRIFALFLTVFIIFFTFGCKNNEDKNTDKNLIEETNKTLKIHCYAHDTLNPLLNNNEANMQFLRLMFESLIVCDETQKAQMVLAENYSVSSDGLTWTVNIKDGVKWHDGTVLTAYDVEKTYSDVLEYMDKSPYFSVLSHLEEVNATSDKTVNFKLISPQANFINLLEVPVVKYHNGEKFLPIGTGPYVYNDTKNKIIYLSANEEWHNGKTDIKNVEVKILPDKETSVYSYVSKEIDIVSVTSTEEWNGYSSNSDNVIVDYPSNVFTYICINPSSEPLSNGLFRRCISYAIDKEKINSEVLLSHGSVANSCINSKWWFYKPDVTNYSFNRSKAIDTAKTLKSNMKIVPVSLMVNEDNADKCKVAEMIKENLSDCGITLYIEYVSWGVFNERVATGNYQMYLGSVKYSADVNPQHVIPNPDTKLQNLFNELQTQTTEEGIKQKYYEIQEKIAMDVQIIPMYFDMSSVMYNKRIEGEHKPYRANIFNGIEKMTLSK